MNLVLAYAASAAGKPFQQMEIDLGPLGPEEVEIAVEHCGICHSDLSVLQNDWGNTVYPAVLGHEVVGRIVAVGEQAKGLQLGQRVGLGWNAKSCMHCSSCMAGDHHLCATVQATILGHYGGFAERVRTHWAWAIPLPESLDGGAVGPLMCGGVTVFAPLDQFDIRPTQRVGVVGIGGLGHLALKFASAWGCEVTAFSSSPSKFDEARGFGAHHVISSRDSDAIRSLAGTLDMLLVAVNVPLDWSALIATLKPRGRLHVVGAVLEPIPVQAFDLIFAQRSISGSPTGSPSVLAKMLDFAARHKIAPQIERFPMSKINEALDHLRAGKARYRIVLDADWAK
ncbi:MAG: NAD(P)-dependent alcohol dehydrogenase [Planctomycetes bacterium]|nr:NAD(P)-dependent alcohol dehydrogenase [Planctomycetota bacterium]